MASVKWIKITTDIFDDEKIILIESLPESYAIITVWFKLLCLAGKQNNCGVFMMGRVPYTDKMLATIFRMKEATVTLALQTFEKFGMIEIIDGVITIPHWDKHQSLDKLEMAREQTRQRVARHREKQKQLAECNVTRNVTVTESNADRIEEDKDIDKDKDIDIELEDKYDKYDKYDKSENSPLKMYSKPNTMTQKLIENGYISEDDLSIDDYNAVFEELTEKYSFEIVRSCLWYFISRWKSNKMDQEDNEIENKFAYFRTAIVDGAERLKRDNKKTKTVPSNRYYTERTESKEEPKTVADDPELMERLKKIVGGYD